MTAGKPGTTIGTREDAAAVYYQHEHDVIDDRLGWVEPCGAGEDRTIYRVGRVAYKIPTRPTANPYDHRMQEEARRRGYRWVPAASGSRAHPRYLPQLQQARPGQLHRRPGRPPPAHHPRRPGPGNLPRHGPGDILTPGRMRPVLAGSGMCHRQTLGCGSPGA